MPADVTRSPGRGNAGRRTAALLVLLAAACTDPSQQVKMLDLRLRERTEAVKLPTVRHSKLDGPREGVRVRIQQSLVEVDDVTLWAALDPKTLGTLVTGDREAPWTHVKDLALGSEPPGESPQHEALVAELRRAHDSATVVLGAREQTDPRSYGIYAEGTAPYRDVVNLMFAAGKVDLRYPWLAVRRADKKVGLLPVGVTEMCDEPRDESEPIVHTGRCEEATVQLSDATIVLRSRHSRHVPDGCIYARKFDPTLLEKNRGGLEAMRKAMEDADGIDSELWGEPSKPSTPSDPDASPLGLPAPTSAKPPQRPPEPCRQLGLEQIAGSPKLLHHALAQLAPGAEPCRQINLAPTYDTQWQQVITVFDALHRLGHERIILLGSGNFEACEAR